MPGQTMLSSVKNLPLNVRNSERSLLMEHIYKDNNHERTIVLLHGTGGDEKSLMPIVDHLNTGYNVLSIRGSVNENGALRYFERKAEGVYDVDSLKTNAKEIINFILQASEEYGFDPEEVVFLGFSNGTNMALHILIAEDSPFNKAALLAPLYPLEVDMDQDLSDYTFFVSMGENDPISPMSENQRLLQILKDLNVNLTNTWVNSHEVTIPMLQELKTWFKEAL